MAEQAVAGLVDADVVIDWLRGLAAAGAWMSASRPDRAGVPGIVVMEVLAGCRDKAALRATEKQLARLEVIWPTAADIRMGARLLADHRLSSGLGIADAIIAAMAVRRGRRLYTFNHRHFGVVPGLDFTAPYPRA